MFAYLWRHPFPHFKSDFPNIGSLGTIRIALEAKGLLNPRQRFITEKFAERFATRVLTISKKLTNCLFFVTVVGLSAGAGLYDEDKAMKIIPGIQAIISLEASAFADVRKWLIVRTDTAIGKLFGYHF